MEAPIAGKAGDVKAPAAGKTGKEGTGIAGNRRWGNRTGIAGTEQVFGIGDEGIGQVLLGTEQVLLGAEQVLLRTGDVEAPIAGRAAHLVQPAEL